MGTILNEVLTPAIGIAMSPIPVIAVILMLMSSRAKTAAPAFALGWVAGILLVALLVMLVVPAEASVGIGGGGIVVGIVLLALGVLFFGLAAHQWRIRPASGSTSRLPKWISGVDTMSLGQVIGIGVALAALNPKNLPLLLAGGLALAHAGDAASGVVGMIVFVVIAASTVIVPVVVGLAARDKVSDALGTARDWLTRNNTTVMLVVFVILGVVLFGRGLGMLF